MASQITHAAMKWTNDGNKLSTHHLKHVILPKKPWNDYAAGDTGVASYPGFPGNWEFVILAVGEYEKRAAETASKKQKIEIEGEGREQKNDVEKNVEKDEKQAEEKKQKTEKRAEGREQKKMDKNIESVLRQQSQKQMVESFLTKTRESSEESGVVTELRDEIKKLKKKGPGSGTIVVAAVTSVTISVNVTTVVVVAVAIATTVFAPPLAQVLSSPLSSPQVLSPPLSSPQVLSPPLPSLQLMSPFRPSPQLMSSEYSLPVSPSLSTSVFSSPATSGLYNGHSMDSLRDCISHIYFIFDCCHAIMSKLFTVEYMLSHSVTGQRPNSNMERKPKFDQRLYGALSTVLKSKFPSIEDTEITAKVHAVQKKYKKKQ